jgi:tryptophan-rich sensory protein
MNLPLIITILTIISNSFNNIKTISDDYKLPFTPAPITFSIWGGIYGMLIYCAYTNPESFNDIMIPYAISAVLNALWIQVWGKSELLSSIILIALASTLIYIVSKLKDDITKTIFTIYATWAVIASLLNRSILLKKYINVDILKYIVLTILTIAPFLFKNIYIIMVIIWASIGIIMSKNIEFIIPILSGILSQII